MSFTGRPARRRRRPRPCAQACGQPCCCSPLVVVPRDQLDEVVVEHNAGRLVEDAGAGAADQVGGNHLIARIADDAVHVRLGRVLDLIADVGIGGRAAQARGQVDHGHVRRGHAEGHTGHLALQGGDNAADGLGRAGGGGDDVVQDGTARTPVAAAAAVDRLLLGGGGMDGGHEGLLDAELLVDDIGERGQTVRRAAGVGDNAHVRAVLVAVDAEDKVGVASSLAGAVRITFFAPPLKWREAFSVVL